MVSSRFHSMRIAATLAVAIFVVTRLDAASVEPIRIDRLAFDVPFAVSAGDTTTTEVELIFSLDSGRQWYSYARVPVAAKAFAFRAPREGEYWFAFRTHGTNGEARQTTPIQPQLRLVVDTAPPPPIPRETGSSPRRRATGAAPTSSPTTTNPSPATTNPSSPSSSPQPDARIRPLPAVREPAATSDVATSDVAISDVAISDVAISDVAISDVAISDVAISDVAIIDAKNASPPRVSSETTGAPPPAALPQLLPAAPGAVRWFPPEDTTPAATELGLSDEAIAELIGDMRPRLAGTASPSFFGSSSATPSPTPSSDATPPAVAPGRITAVSLATDATQPRIIVRWATPPDPKVAAASRVDVLRGASGLGPWRPLVLHYENSGEYWWYLAAEDFEPFFLAVRTVNAAGDEVSFDKTTTPIALDASMVRSQ